MQEKTIITISRQFGSGGKEIAEILAEKWVCAVTTARSSIWQRRRWGSTEVDIESILEFCLPDTRQQHRKYGDLWF